ncbi:MAG: YcxB family protein [Clostridia bacterium]|nr:YcxB family protein [Clostridia bacterium]
MRVMTNRFSASTVLLENEFSELLDSKFKLWQEKRIRNAVLILGIAVFIIAILIIGWSGSFWAWFSRIAVLAIIAAAVIFGTDPLIKYLKSFILKRSLELSKNNGAKLNYGFNEDNFTIVFDNQHSIVNYSSVKNITESDKSFVIWCDENSGFVINKSGFNFGEISEFPKFLKDKTNKDITAI